MPLLTAEVLYEMLLEIKAKDPNHAFDSLDLLQFGNVDKLMEQLIAEGKIIMHNNVIESFEVVG